MSPAFDCLELGVVHHLDARIRGRGLVERRSSRRRVGRVGVADVDLGVERIDAERVRARRGRRTPNPSRCRRRRSPSRSTFVSPSAKVTGTLEPSVQPCSLGSAVLDGDPVGAQGGDVALLRIDVEDRRQRGAVPAVELASRSRRSAAAAKRVEAVTALNSGRSARSVASVVADAADAVGTGVEHVVAVEVAVDGTVDRRLGRCCEGHDETDQGNTDHQRGRVLDAVRFGVRIAFSRPSVPLTPPRLAPSAHR